MAAAATGENLTHAGWSHTPSWYLVSAQDHAIAPEAQRFMAQRMGATTEEIDGSHVAFMAQPGAVASFIARSLDSLAG